MPATSTHALIGLGGESVLSPEDHHDILHSTPHATAIYWQKYRGKRGRRFTKVRPGDPAPEMARLHKGRKERYVTVNEFAAWKRLQHLRSLRSLYVDIDGNQDVHTILDACFEAKLPEPGYIVDSGRGLHLYWLLEPVSHENLGLWQACEERLTKALKPLGADPVAKDCTRLLRVPGTINAKSETVAEGKLIRPEHWPLEDIAEEILGRRSNGKVRDIRPRQKGRAQRRSGGHRTIYQWWHRVYRDLIAIYRYHWFGGIPEGCRDRWLFLTSVSLSWFVKQATLDAEIADTARTFTPTLWEGEALRYTKTVREKAAQAAQGNQVYWQGTARDPRYWFRAQTLYEWLADLINDELQPQLRAIAPESVLAERKVLRDRQRWADRYTGRGYRQSQAERVAEAVELYQEGWTQREIAEHVGATQQTVSAWLKRALSR